MLEIVKSNQNSTCEQAFVVGGGGVGGIKQGFASFPGPVVCWLQESKSKASTFY